MKLKSMMFLAMALAVPSSVLAVDITAAVRAAGAATYDVTGGKEYNASYPLFRAFDGGITTDAERALITPNSGYPDIAVYYHIAPTFCAESNIVVTAFKMRRSPNTYDSLRTPMHMRLEASPTGATDGTDWVVLAESDGIFPGWENGHSPSADEIEFTVPVIRCRQGSYRHYRFVFVPRHTTPNAFHELYLIGEITAKATPERLTWSGSGTTWDDSSEQWTDTNAVSVAWKPFSSAAFATSLSASGAKNVAALDFGDASPLALSGDAIRFANPAGVGIVKSVTVGADVSSFAGEDTDSACAAGTRTSYTYLPRDPDDTSMKKGLEVIWWRNRRLCDITGFAPALLLYRGDSGWEAAKARGAKALVNDGSAASVWFWRYYAAGTGSHAWICAKVLFRQVGNDISARLDRCGFAWVAGSDPAKGDEVDYETALPQSSTAIYDDTGAPGSSNYVGVRGLLAQSSTSDGLNVACARRNWELKKFEDQFVADPTNPFQSTKVLFATNLKVSEITGFSHAMLWYQTTEQSATPLYFKREGDALTCQFQRVHNDSNVLCIKARFTQEGDDVYVQGLYARFKNSTYEVGVDFDTDESVGSMKFLGATGTDVTYTLSKIVPTVVRERPVCTFGGNFAVRGAVTADGADLAFADEVSVRDAAMFAETPVTMNGGSALSVAAGVAATMPALSVAGTVSLSFGTGASLSVSSISLPYGATVELGGSYVDKSLRIGTSATLSKSDLRKFSVSDPSCGVVQDADGYLVVQSHRGMILLVR